MRPGFNPELNALHQVSRTVLQVQTGNVARAFYDLMKMQSLHDQGRAACGVLIVPTLNASRVIGGNLANFDRVHDELQGLYFDQVTIPELGPPGSEEPTPSPVTEDGITDVDEREEVLPGRHTVTSYGADFLVDGLVTRLRTIRSLSA